MNWIKAIKHYQPSNEQEKSDKEMILYAIETFEDVLTRNNKIAHMTSSAFIVNKKRDKTLMIHHNIYNSWSITGGHVDGETDLLAVALREAIEETGITNATPISSDIFSLDLLPVLGHMRKGVYISAHLHLSIIYLFEADERESLMVNPDENSDVKWLPMDEIEAYSNEPHMITIYKKLRTKLETGEFQ